MQKKTGAHFYINIANFDDVAELEEAATQGVKHSIHELDSFFSSVEAYGLKRYPGLFSAPVSGNKERSESWLCIFCSPHQAERTKICISTRWNLERGCRSAGK